MPRTIVIGGGMAGLVAAHTRASAGEEVVLLEASAEPGGVVRSVRRDGYLLEAGPNTVRPTPELMDLVTRLGLESEVRIADPALPRYIDFAGRLHELAASPLALLTTGLLSLGGKARLLTEPFRRSPAPPGESVRDFFARRLGPEVADRLVTPFVSGIFAGDASALSAEAAFPSLFRWDRDHGSLVVGAVREARSRPKAPRPPRPRGLLSFRDGLATLPRALARTLGPSFRPNSAVTSVSPSGSGFRLTVGTSHGDLEADRVILATDAAAAARLVRPFEPEAADALDAIPYPPLAVLHLSLPEAALRRPLVGFGHLVVPDPSRRILGAVWSSSLFPDRAPEGRALLTVFLGGARDPKAASLSDEALLEVAGRDLSAQGLSSQPPDLVLLTRWPRAIPQYTSGHGSRIGALERAETRSPGLRFIGNYRGGISVGDVVKSALAV